MDHGIPIELIALRRRREAQRNHVFCRMLKLIDRRSDVHFISQYKTEKIRHTGTNLSQIDSKS
jgi:hypothetical protein